MEITLKKSIIFIGVVLAAWFAYSWYTDGSYDPNAKYIGNRSKEKFHKITCRYVKRMREENKFYSVTRQKLVKKGMRPAMCCRP